ncbi:rabaptin, RAB GTPase binding effector protein 2 [Homo sapiens]|uniref:Rab GTPase-binding effector protein 2 n=3 Tax=Homo sapiens TaxID=9606 RepID=RABE2_HUMAN|nr:rab GTPase-binding effector protein 2 [Homo sapiens]Q9H5N1.2 RecName: Full=Rab GTPase-binding effector protein 2; AltName: Full=Rabaptin-5beta [Homo sapiens]KAI2577899.1 rabaptin, RAB GTPase binding effector protein 2 [Homo sapiens]KAI4054308.1 rabaptin, RAB GTPase binding effector protein 2 [Homo sapiens]|eukprot:NP_079092.2 rab GTPase-binding effector protein 2 [Homo sapiens]
MAAAAPVAADDDERRRRPGAALEDSRSQEGANGEAESGELSRLRAELAGALAEMETMKAVAEVSESTKAEAVAAVQRQCQEEVASLQAILKDSISSYEAQITALKQERQQQQQDCEEKERELGRLKQLLSRAYPLDSLEKQMEKAHEDSEKLREIVLPMEKEIEELKAKLLRAEELIQEIQRRPRHAPSLHGSTELLPLSRDPSPPLEPLEELSGDGGPAAEAFAHNCDDSASISSFSLGGGVGSSSSLPQSRQGLSPEQEETASLVSTGTLVPEGIYLPPPGYQLVPDTQWEQLQTEGRQLQKDLESVSRERDELQEGLRRSNEDCAKQMQVLLAQVQNSEQLLRTLQGTVSQAQERVQLQMAELVTTHKCLHHEVKRLNEENQGLRAEQLPSSAPQGSQQEQGEEESLPSSVPELQQLLCCTRQEARARLQAQEHGAERLRIEIVTLREALEEETVARASLEGQLRVQREETEVLEASLCSLRTEMERVQQEQSKAQLPDLLSEQRAKVLRLQAELETSEQVQRDFVRLSQALQVRLERIRQAETLEQVRSIMDEAPLTDVRDIKDT